jgi:hypothetical protein
MGMKAWLQAAKECFAAHPLAALVDEFNDLDPGVEGTGPTLDERLLKAITGVP